MIKTRKSWRQKQIHLVITVYNEEEVIESVVRECSEFVKELPHGKLIVTEDGSTDNTKSILKRLQKELPIKIYMSPRRKGATAGFRNALKIAEKGADLVLFSDSDSQHRIRDFFRLLPLSDKYDMVIGWKKRRQDDWKRIYGSKIINLYLNFLFGLRLHDINCGFRVINKKLLKEVLPQTTLFPECILTELTLRARLLGFPFTETPVTHNKRNNANRAWQGKNMAAVVSRLILNSLRIKYLGA